MIRPESRDALIGSLPTIPATADTGADDALRVIRGATVEEVVEAASIAGLTDAQHRAVMLALAARFRAKAARKAAVPA